MRDLWMCLALVLALAACGGGQQETVKSDQGTVEAKPKKVGLADLKAHVAKHLNTIEQCYNDWVQVEPKPAGTVDLVLLIEPEGNVSQAGAQAETMPQGFVDCISDTVVSWPFFPARKSPHAVKIDYKIKMTPGPEGAKAELL